MTTTPTQPVTSKSEATAPTFDSLEPATGALVASFPVHTAEDVRSAVERARPAALWWHELGFDGRKKRLRAWRSIIASRLDEFAELIHRENGKPAFDAIGELSLAIEHLDWAACVARYDRPHTFFYMDPPYWQTAGYGVDFGIEQYEKMAELLGTLKGKAIVSLNDHPDIRRIFGAFQTETVPIQYTVGGGGKAVERQELIIYSCDRDSEPAGLF